MTLHEMLYMLPKHRLLELRDTRVNRLIQEQKSLEKAQKESQREATRQQILAQ